MCLIKSWHHGKCNAMAVGPVCEEFTDCDIYDTVRSAPSTCLRPALISEDGRQQASLQLTCAAPDSR